mmetsp:Transcript_40723/g.97725  ORF Transcript_40723/g.97725 Transcript_40723/m.97725 type:complete len:120 (-) Transcript_40723:13-372(-)
MKRSSGTARILMGSPIRVILFLSPRKLLLEVCRDVVQRCVIPKACCSPCLPPGKRRMSQLGHSSAVGRAVNRVSLQTCRNLACLQSSPGARFVGFSLTMLSVGVECPEAVASVVVSCEQ